MVPDRENIRFNTLRNALYHTARRRRFERWSRIFSFLVVILGAAAIGDLLSGLGIDQKWIGAVVALVGALQLVFDFAGQARMHQALQRDYYHLLADIEAKTDPTEVHCAEWYSKMIRITADEPPFLRAVDAKAYNDAASATEVPPGERLHIPFLHRIFANVFSFEGHDYKKLCELPGWEKPKVVR
ncbi:MAG: hypothetical protein JKY94_09895 [Rhodobacteraceae bacterium]|nr:hypothetical protein [Paracoccaceae bacterium]